ncbi:hypothetical protein J437_LFUL001934, partial [Ladona fulva]
MGVGETLKAVILLNLDRILSQKEQSADLARCIMSLPQYSCPLFRLLLLPLGEGRLSSNEVLSAQMRVCSVIIDVSENYNIESPLNGLLQRFLKAKKRIDSGSALMKVHPDSDLAEDLQNMPLLHLEQHGKWLLEEGLQKYPTSKLVEAMAKLLLDQEKKSSVVGGPEDMRTGLFVDWLGTFEPEMIGSCPQLQMKLLFSKSDQEIQRVINDGKYLGGFHDVEMIAGKLMTKGTRSFRPYLLTLLAHQAGWATLHQCVQHFLEKCDT